MALFGTSGIRMTCPDELTASLALTVGAAAAQKGKPFVVGYDGRGTGQMLKAAVAAGAASVGAKVIDIGFCATPTLALHTQNCGGRGAMITASHNPPEYNGIKLFENGREAPKKVEEEVELAVAGKKKPLRVEWKEAGQVIDEEEKAVEAHMKLALANVDAEAIRKKNPKVVVDCGQAGGAALMPLLLEEAGCSVIAINSDAPGKFTRGLEPTEKNLAELSAEVVACGADLGIAHDGDADRAIIFDEKGKMLGQDVQIAIAVGDVIEKIKREGGKAEQPTIVSTVESSLALREIVEAAGAKLQITPVGSLFVAERMRKSGAVFGGEPCGEYIYENAVQMPDGLLTGLKFVEIFCKKGKLSSLASKIKAYPLLREKLPCANEKKTKAMEKIAAAWPYSKPAKNDGLRSDENWGWVLVRPSGTEPIMRITLEAKTKEEAEKRMEETRKIVQKAISGAG